MSVSRYQTSGQRERDDSAYLHDEVAVEEGAQVPVLRGPEELVQSTHERRYSKRLHVSMTIIGANERD